MQEKDLEQSDAIKTNEKAYENRPIEQLNNGDGVFYDEEYDKNDKDRKSVV